MILIAEFLFIIFFYESTFIFENCRKNKSDLRQRVIYNLVPSLTNLQFFFTGHNQNLPQCHFNDVSESLSNAKIECADFINFDDLDYNSLFNTYWYDESLQEAKKDEQFFTNQSQVKNVSCQTDMTINNIQSSDIYEMKNCITALKNELCVIKTICQNNICNECKLTKLKKKECTENQIVKKYKTHPDNKNLISII